MNMEANSPRTLIAVSFILLLMLSACGLLGPKSKIDSSVDAKDLILLLDDLSRDFEAEDTEDLEDLLENLLDDFTSDFEGRTDIEAFSYGIPREYENVLGFTIEIKEPADWAVYDEDLENFEDDFIEELLDLAEVGNDYESDDFDLGFGDSSAAYTIEYDEVTTDIFTFRRDRFAYIIVHLYVDKPDTDAEELADTLDERILDLYGVDDPDLEKNEGLEIRVSTNLEWLFLGEDAPVFVEDVAVEEPAAEPPAVLPEEPAVEEPVQITEEPAAAIDPITILVFFTDDEFELFEETAQHFTQVSGIEVEVANADSYELLSVLAAAGDPPDIGMIYNPAEMREFAARGDLVPLSEDVIYQLYYNYHPDWIEMGSYQAVPYGVFHRVYTRSLVWYPKQAFEDMGYQVPYNWESLTQLENEIVADGGTPWCVGIESSGATGWVGSDWIEDIVIRTAGPYVYDQWANHEIQFNDPAIRNAFEILAARWFDPEIVYGGPESIATTSFWDAITPMFNDPPDCWLHRQGSFITSFLPDEILADLDRQLGVFAFPEIESEYGTPMIVTGAQFVAFSDRPGVMEFLGYLGTSESAAHWIKAGNYLFPHWDQNLLDYPTELEYWQAIYLLDASFLRWDASDQMPDPTMGVFWNEILNWLNGQELDTTLENIEASWP